MEFQRRANRINPKIQVDLRFSTEKLEFLDMWVHLIEGEIKTTVYCKPTDTHTYLHVKSDHPKTVKTAIPYGLAVRAKRISSSEQDYQDQRTMIKEQLKN